jgi:hypothetical protein
MTHILHVGDFCRSDAIQGIISNRYEIISLTSGQSKGILFVKAEVTQFKDELRIPFSYNEKMNSQPDDQSIMFSTCLKQHHR